MYECGVSGSCYTRDDPSFVHRLIKLLNRLIRKIELAASV